MLNTFTSEKSFNFKMPISFMKGENEGEWRIKGLASTDAKDLQGENILQDGLDISELKAGRGIFNYDHREGPENVLGIIDTADVRDNGLEVEGYLLQHQPRAKAFYDIMRSLKPEHQQRVQFSIEGKIMQRAGEGGKTIKAAKVEKVALTLDPVNTETYAELVKSLNHVAKEIEGEEVSLDDLAMLKSKLSLLFNLHILKALSAGTGYAGAPTAMTGGGVLTNESLEGDQQKKVKASVMKMIEDYKKDYPELSGEEIGKMVHSRLEAMNTGKKLQS